MLKRQLLVLLLIALCLPLTGCQGLILIDGHSMEPTLPDGTLTFNVPYKSPAMIQRFDVVLCRFPGREYLVVKRIVGLPGDTIAISEGTLYLNGIAISEPWADNVNPWEEVGPLVVPEDCCYVLGDNRGNSLDSRYENVGPIPFDHIEGEIIMTLWPEMASISNLLPAGTD